MLEVFDVDKAHGTEGDSGYEVGPEVYAALEAEAEEVEAAVAATPRRRLLSPAWDLIFRFTGRHKKSRFAFFKDFFPAYFYFAEINNFHRS